MSDFLNAMSTLFTFLFTQMSSVASFFTTNLLGQIILGIILFGIIIEVLMVVISKIRG